MQHTALKMASDHDRPFSQATLVDAGCGTGNYTLPLSAYFGETIGLDENAGMLARAKEKYERQQTSNQTTLRFVQASLAKTGLKGQSTDCICINMVLHHLSDATKLDSDQRFDPIKAAFSECWRILKPGGVLSISTVAHPQARDGYWWAAVIPQAVETTLLRYPTIEWLIDALRAFGFQNTQRVVPLDAVLQGDAYLNSRGPFDPKYRLGDSTWAMASKAELCKGLARLQEQHDSGEIEGWMAEREAKRRRLGQMTFVLCRKPDS